MPIIIDIFQEAVNHFFLVFVSIDIEWRDLIDKVGIADGVECLDTWRKDLLGGLGKIHLENIRQYNDYCISLAVEILGMIHKIQLQTGGLAKCSIDFHDIIYSLVKVTDDHHHHFPLGRFFLIVVNNGGRSKCESYRYRGSKYWQKRTVSLTTVHFLPSKSWVYAA